MSLFRKSSRRFVFFSKMSSCPPAAASLLGWSMVSILCIGMEQPAISTSRRFPYSSYFPSQTSSVRSCESGCGFAGPYFLPLLLIRCSLSSLLPGRSPLIGDILFGSVAHYPGQGHLFLFGEIFQRFVKVGRKTDRRAHCRRAALSLHASCRSLSFLDRKSTRL